MGCHAAAWQGRRHRSCMSRRYHKRAGRHCRSAWNGRCNGGRWLGRQHCGRPCISEVFEDHNVDPDASPKSKSAARQQRYRERQKLESDVTRNVTRNVTRDAKVTPREEKSRRKDNPKAPCRGEGWRLPDWIPADPWRQFEEMRRKKKKPMTDAARKLAVTKLDALRAADHDVATMMDQSILHAWDVLPAEGRRGVAGALGSDQPWTGAV